MANDQSQPKAAERTQRLKDQDLEQDGAVHLGRTGNDGLLTNHEKTPSEKRNMLDDDRKAYDYKSPSDENDLREDHRAEDEE